VAPQAGPGKLQLLAVTSPQRSALLPSLPTLREAGIAGVEADAWVGLIAPAGTSEAVLARIHKAVVATLAEPAWSRSSRPSSWCRSPILPRSSGPCSRGARPLGADHRRRRHQGRVGDARAREPC
jgi:tripartite-type tricarboxylate transporter receptor subunit TctC